MAQVTEAFLRDHYPLPQAAADADKEDRGRALVIAGSPEVPGAALLSGETVLRAGAGKVTIATSSVIALAIGVAFPEARVVGLRTRPAGQVARLMEERQAALIGPGMDERLARTVTAAALGVPRVPLILDAGAQEGLWSKARLLQRRARKAALVLTPHAGEMATLIGKSKDEIVAEPARAASHAAAHLGATIVLKGAHTIVATPQGDLFQHDGDVEGLATSGSGDVLAGLITGLVARGADVLTSSLWGVFLHAEAGRHLAKRIGTVGYLARELAAEIPQLVADAAER